jgi:hypothetical protein
MAHPLGRTSNRVTPPHAEVGDDGFTGRWDRLDQGDAVVAATRRTDGAARGWENRFKTPFAFLARETIEPPKRERV